MQQRYYDPIAGRFLSIDPVTTDADSGKGFGRYTYVNNNPYTKIDPDGRDPADAFRRLTSRGGPLAPLAQAWNKIVGPDKAVTPSVDVKLEVGAALGIGLEIEQSFSTGVGSISFLPVAEGLSGGIFAQPAEGYKIATFGSGDSPVTFKGAGEVKGGFILVGAAEAEVNPGGQVTVTPKAGIGAGELVKYGPSIKIFEWGKKEKAEQPKKESEIKKVEVK